MSQSFSFNDFLTRFPDNDTCLEEIKKLRYPNGIYCALCKATTKHYKISRRTAYSCKFCRSQIFPLAQTIFEKSSTPLRLWFFAMYLMTYTKGNISITQLHEELGVTYKTAWRIFDSVYHLMEQGGDLLDDSYGYEEDNSIRRWVFFNKLQLTVVQKQETEDK